MDNSCKEHFSDLNERFRSVIDESFSSEFERNLSDLFHFSEDLHTWVTLLDGKADTTILLSAIQEYELGFQAVVSGQYRYAFIAHRYFLEQICRFIFLSSNELYLRHWKIGLKDISWGALVDSDNGIFSKEFIRAFYPEVESEGLHLIAIVKKLYRESSEFIHGNFSKIEVLPNTIEFNKDILKTWLDFIETSKFVAVFLLFVRFSKDLDSGSIHNIEEMAREELSGIEEFNLLFQS